MMKRQLSPHTRRRAPSILPGRGETGNPSLDRAVAAIVETARPDRVILFGSRARGVAEGDSDYDVCVLKRGVRRRRALAQEIYCSLLGLGVAVDVIVETPARFEKLKDNPFLVYAAIARDGRVVYERPFSRS